MDLFLNDNLFILIIYLAAAADAIKTNVYHFKKGRGGARRGGLLIALEDWTD